MPSAVIQLNKLRIVFGLDGFFLLVLEHFYSSLPFLNILMTSDPLVTTQNVFIDLQLHVGVVKPNPGIGRNIV